MASEDSFRNKESRASVPKKNVQDMMRSEAGNRMQTEEALLEEEMAILR